MRPRKVQRRARGRDRRGHGRAGVGSVDAPSAAGRARRQQAGDAVPARARARTRDVCRRAGRDGDRRDRCGGAGRRRAGRPSTTSRSTPVIDVRDAVRTGAPQLWPEAPGNIAIDWAGPHPDPRPMRARSSASSRRRTHVARVTVHQPAADPRHHGAARRHRAATTPANDGYTLRVCSQSAGRACATTPCGHATAEGEAAGHHRGRRRRVRHEDRRLSRIYRAAGRRARSPSARCTGWRRARSPSSTTLMRATP